MSASIREKVQAVTTSFAASTRIMNEIIIYEKIKEGKMKLRCDFVLMSLILTTVGQQLELIGREKNLVIQLENSMACDMIHYLFCDICNLEQALVSVVHYVSNYAPSRSTITVSINLR